MGVYNRLLIEGGCANCVSCRSGMRKHFADWAFKLESLASRHM
jgi:hypothetical protein